MKKFHAGRYWRALLLRIRQSTQIHLIIAILLSNVIAPSLSLAITTFEHADLSHEVYTATGTLYAQLVDPPDAGAVDESSTPVTVQTGLHEGVELKVNDILIPFSQIGKRVVNYDNNTTAYTYYGIPLEPGPNLLTLTPLGAQPTRGTPVTAIIFGAGPITQMSATIDDTLVADGRTPVTLTIHAVDGWGHHARIGDRLHVDVASGNALMLGGVTAAQSNTALPHEATPSASLDLEVAAGGIAQAKLIPGLQPGQVVLHLSTDTIQNQASFTMQAQTRKPFVTGFVTGGIGAVPAVPTDPTSQQSRRGQAALFGSGMISRRDNLTLAYNTDHPLAPNSDNGQSANDQLDTPYSTYGDASTRQDAALSQSHLYARLDHGSSSALWGEFTAKTAGDASATSYSKLVNGAQILLNSKNGKNQFMGFDARNPESYARLVIPANGLSTAAVSLHPNIVTQSETVYLVTLDRHTGAILSQTPLTRDIDYAITYSIGALRFINIPLPYDASFNPNELIIQYEYGTVGSESKTMGASLTRKIGLVKVNSSYINENDGAFGINILSQDVGMHAKNSSWSFSHAHASGAVSFDDPSIFDPTQANTTAHNGDAYRGTFSQTNRHSLFNADFSSTSSGFSNPYGGLTTPGFLNYHMSYTGALRRKLGDFGVDFVHEQNDLSTVHSAQSTLRAHLNRKISSKLTVDSALNGVSSTNSLGFSSQSLFAVPTASPTIPPVPLTTATNAPVSNSTALQAEVAAHYQASKNTKIDLRRVSNLLTAGNAISSEPGESDGDLTIALAHGGQAYLRELWTDSPTESFATSTSGLTGTADASHSTAIGFERRLSNATSFTSEYGVDRTGNDNSVYSRLGVKTRYELTHHLSGDMQFQTSGSSVATGDGYDIYGLNLNYHNAQSIRSTLGLNERMGASAGQTVSLGTAVHLVSNLSFVSTFEDDHSGGATAISTICSLSLRPTDNDRMAMLASYQHQSGSVTQYGSGANDILSLDAVSRLRTKTEVATRIAYKLDGDSYASAHTSLLALRVKRDLSNLFDIAGEMRATRADSITGGNTTGGALEAGIHIGNTIRLAAGVTLTPVADPSLVGPTIRRGPYITVTSTINHLFGWGL